MAKTIPPAPARKRGQPTAKTSAATKKAARKTSATEAAAKKVPAKQPAAKVQRVASRDAGTGSSTGAFSQLNAATGLLAEKQQGTPAVVLFLDLSAYPEEKILELQNFLAEHDITLMGLGVGGNGGP